jgi:hypothetical protein
MDGGSVPSIDSRMRYYPRTLAGEVFQKYFRPPEITAAKCYMLQLRAVKFD